MTVAERNAEIVRRAKAGERPRQIADALGIEPNIVGVTLANARKTDLDIPVFRRLGPVRRVDLKAAIDPRPRAPKGNRRELVIFLDEGDFRAVVKLAERERLLPREIGEALVLEALSTRRGRRAA